MAIIILFLIFLLYLSLEALKAHIIRRKIPLRIVVTGVRGKSSVTRLITTFLQSSDMKVLGKVTGSSPVLIYPNGSEQVIHRRGQPNVLEQVKVLLKRANSLRVSGIVTESMSIKPEILKCEIQGILKPNLIVITKISVDHIEDLGNELKTVRKNIAKVCNSGATVITLKNNLDEDSIKIIRKKNCKIIEIDDFPEMNQEITNYFEFNENIQLALKACEHIGVDNIEISKALQKVSPDIGALKCWKFPKGALFVNGFAANDPDSTIKVYDLAKIKLSSLMSTKKFGKVVGILNLRSDRVDRTLQWLNHLKFWSPFNLIYVIGEDNKLFARKIKDKRFIPIETERLIEKIESETETLFFGFGNIAGESMKILKRCQEVGECIRHLP